MMSEFSVDFFLTPGLETELQDIPFELLRDGWQPPGWIDNGHAGVPQPFAWYDLHIIGITLQEGAQALPNHATAAGGTIAVHDRKRFPGVPLDPLVVKLDKLCQRLMGFITV